MVIYAKQIYSISGFCIFFFINYAREMIYHLFIFVFKRKNNKKFYHKIIVLLTDTVDVMRCMIFTITFYLKILNLILWKVFIDYSSFIFEFKKE